MNFSVAKEKVWRHRENILTVIITARLAKRANVMFSQASVCLQGGVCLLGDLPTEGVCIKADPQPGGREPGNTVNAQVVHLGGGGGLHWKGGETPAPAPPRYGQVAVGTHPTGMHSCLNMLIHNIYLRDKTNLCLERFYCKVK